jgi:hypothetical protein
MTATFGNLDTREIARSQYQLLGDFWVLDPKEGKIVARKSFVTNYASIDILRKIMLLAFYALLAGYGDKSATIHDWLYSGYGIVLENGAIYYPPRKACDEVFYRALLAEGVGKVRAKLFYWGVRVGGSSHFTKTAQVFVPEDVFGA